MSPIHSGTVGRRLRRLGRGIETLLDLDAIFLAVMTLGLLRLWRSDRVPLVIKAAATMSVAGVVALVIWAELAS